MDYEHIHFSMRRHVAMLRLNRPHCLNSCNALMLDEIRDVLRIVQEGDAARCLLLTGTGRGFCAGQDLNDRVDNGRPVAPDLSESLEKRYNPIIRDLVNLRVPVVCAVNGVAAGAGANLALACDIVIAARSASFIQAFCKIGLIPDAGGTWHLPRLAGTARALGLSLLGETLSAERAEQWGLIWQVVDDEQLMDEANALASRLADLPTRALGLIKRAIRTGTVNTLDEQLDLERDLQAQALDSGDYLEGVLAFIEKRPAEFNRE